MFTASEHFPTHQRAGFLVRSPTFWSKTFLKVIRNRGLEIWCLSPCVPGFHIWGSEPTGSCGTHVRFPKGNEVLKFLKLSELKAGITCAGPSLTPPKVLCTLGFQLKAEHLPQCSSAPRSPNSWATHVKKHYQIPKAEKKNYKKIRLQIDNSKNPLAKWVQQYTKRIMHHN